MSARDPDAFRALVASSDGRWRTLHASGRAWQDRQAARQALATRRGPVEGARRPVREISSVPLGEREQSWTIWRGGPALVRSEFTIGPEQVTAVAQGPRWWRWSPRLGATSGSGAGRPPGLMLGPMAVLLDGARLVEQLEFDAVTETTVAKRAALRVLGRPVSRGARTRLALREAGSAAEHYEVVADAERGTLLVVRAWSAGEAFQGVETATISFDEELAATLFQPETPGGDRFTGEIHRVRQLSPEDLAGKAEFAVVVPVPNPSPVPPHVAYFEADQRSYGPAHAVVTYALVGEDGTRGQLRLLLSGSAPPRSVHETWRSEAGFELGEERRGQTVRRKVRLPLSSGFAELSSSVLAFDRLVEIARTLSRVEPASDS